MQILDPEFEVRLVILPRHTIHAGGGFALSRAERRRRPATARPTPTWLTADPDISRFPHKARPYVPGSQTTPGPTGARNTAPADLAFRQVHNVGTRIAGGFAAHWLAYTLLDRRCAD